MKISIILYWFPRSHTHLIYEVDLAMNADLWMFLRRSMGHPFSCSLLVFGVFLLWLSGDALGQAAKEIAPVRVGDEIEVKLGNKWYPGTVLSFDNGTAEISYSLNSLTADGKFQVADLRFPNNEGHWIVWSDTSGKFRIEARYISRTATNVTIRKVDGSEATVPIERLTPQLRKLLAQTPITGEENKINGAVPVRVGDKVQVKQYFDWNDGVVSAIKVGGAIVEVSDRFGSRKDEFAFKDMRFPNGEGPWQEWTDASKSFSVIARYIIRDPSHVTLRKEDGATVRVEIEKLSPQLRKILALTPIITRRPEAITFIEGRGSLNGGTLTSSAPTIEKSTLTVSEPKPSRSLRLTEGGFGFVLEEGDAISRAMPVAGPNQWVAIGTFGSRNAEMAVPARLFWASPAKKSKLDGPKFLSDERILAYSAEQSRLITTVVKGTWDEPVELCSYRLEPGASAATPEVSWPMPDQGRSSGQAKISLELIGKERLLWGYGTTISMLNMSTHQIEYSIGGLDRSSLWVSPDEKYFAAFDSNVSISVYSIESGEKLATQSWTGYGSSTASFSDDGRYLACVNSVGIQVWSLGEKKPEVLLPLGGVNVHTDVPLSVLRGGWVAIGNQFYSVGLKMVVWRYEGRGVKIAHQQMIGNELLAVGTAGGYGKPPTVLVGAASVPHKDAIELMKKVDPAEVKMLKPGAKIRIEASGDARIAAGLRAAVTRNGWLEDPSAEAVLVGTAELGKAETRTYRVTSYGRRTNTSGEETHTVQPWQQFATIKLGDQRAWGTSMGGIPSFLSASGEDASLGAELAKSSQPSYMLFETLQIPPEILYPKFQQGLGVTWLTPNGFVDEAN